jgi:hypothetical protein
MWDWQLRLRSRPVTTDHVADVAACQLAFRNFALHSGRAAPLYGVLADGVAADPGLAGLLLLAPPEQRQPVLLFASVHWLVLHDREAPLARHYPNLHLGAVPQSDPVTEFRAFCRERHDELAELLATRRTQTNEIGRTALFVPAFGLLERDRGPLAHVDVGASAGLNLLTPSYDLHYEPGGVLTAGSDVVIRCGTRGEPPIPARHPTIAVAVGLDAAPVDVSDAAQALWLEACVWPDQVERFDRLAAAIATANRVGVDVRAGDAADGVVALVAEVADVAHPVVTTSWVLNYLSSEHRARFVAALDAAGAARDVSWVYAENPALCPELPGVPERERSADEPTAVVLVRWRDGRRTATHLADAHPHGRWLHWVSRVQP